MPLKEATSTCGLLWIAINTFIQSKQTLYLVLFCLGFFFEKSKEILSIITKHPSLCFGNVTFVSQGHPKPKTGFPKVAPTGNQLFAFKPTKFSYLFQVWRLREGFAVETKMLVTLKINLAAGFLCRGDKTYWRDHVPPQGPARLWSRGRCHCTRGWRRAAWRAGRRSPPGPAAAAWTRTPDLDGERKNRLQFSGVFSTGCDSLRCNDFPPQV